jgi:hypothetical protein
MLKPWKRVDQSAILVNGTIIGGLQSPPSGWFEASVQGAVYLAATKAQKGSLEYQQLAVSHAAHDTLIWIFHGTRLYATVNSKLTAIQLAIGLNHNTAHGREAIEIGRAAARQVIFARTNDGINNYVPWTPLPTLPGNYQPTPGGQPIPDTPQAAGIKLFGGVGNVTRFRAPPPLSAISKEYGPYLHFVKSYGVRNSTVRKPYDTEVSHVPKPTFSFSSELTYFPDSILLARK